MFTFRDYYDNVVKLSFADHPFSKHPKHVWVICMYNNKWLLTEHKDRGLEFPGGNVEKGETAREAAIREVREETGGIIRKITYIGQYYVQGKGGNIIKNVYVAEIAELRKQATYFETNGPVLLSEIPTNVKDHELYSFIMKDDVLTHCLQYLKARTDGSIPPQLLNSQRN
ncbi:MAG TPA: nucleoside triphosphatase YtkD [Bacillota bacterium]